MWSLWLFGVFERIKGDGITLTDGVSSNHESVDMTAGISTVFSEGALYHDILEPSFLP